ncbi:MAG: glutaredoxin family protein [Desulfococcaceae bacterium]|nr:glutaredoxin family protein [Desulfococcaceae bacterium]
MNRFIFIIITVCFCCSSAFAELYFWTDKKGVKHFTNTKPETEEENLETIKEYTDTQKEENTAVTNPDAFSAKPVIKPKPRKKENYRQDKEVVMYSTRRCGYCRKAKSFFNKNNIRYTDYDVGSSEEARNKFKELNGKGVPLIFIGNQRISGYNEPAIRNALGL